jgi:O-antigen/teichoic acid export membrane protein
MFALDSVISAFLLIFYYKYIESHTIFEWKPRFKVMKSLLKDSWPLILSGIAIMIYMRIDQIMIGSMLSDQAVGIYSAAVKLSETWYFLPMIITASVFPAILNARKKSKELYLKRIQTLYDAFTWFTISVALVVTLLSPFIINLLYGSAFAEAATVLSIHIWAGVFVFWGVASSQYLVAENLTKISFYRTLAGGIINIILNIVLIPIYGIIGAAVATVISYGSPVIFLLFFSKTRSILRQIFKSFNIIRVIKEVFRC